jgi:hypothetical protein
MLRAIACKILLQKYPPGAVIPVSFDIMFAVLTEMLSGQYWRGTGAYAMHWLACGLIGSESGLDLFKHPVEIAAAGIPLE